MRFLLVALAAILMQGCATITSGTTNSIAVVTEPPGAACQLKRGDEVLAVVDPTPGTATVSKSVRPLTVDCMHPQGQPGGSVVESRFQAATLGNILAGGVIGLAVDAASGAMGTYPENVTVVLAPQQFENGALRDSFFQVRADEVRQQYGDKITAARLNCAPGAPSACTDQIRQLEAERDAALQRIEERRRASPVLGL